VPTLPPFRIAVTGTTQCCPRWRRLAAIVYDLVLLLAVFMAATVPVMLLTGGRAVTTGNAFYAAYLLLIAYLYFSWQWVHGGQTLGMRAWRIRVILKSGLPCDWRGAGVRILWSTLSLAAAGLGFFWIMVDGRRMAWHDLFSPTLLVAEVAPSVAQQPADQPQ